MSDWLSKPEKMSTPPENSTAPVQPFPVLTADEEAAMRNFWATQMKSWDMGRLFATLDQARAEKARLQVIADAAVRYVKSRQLVPRIDADKYISLAIETAEIMQDLAQAVIAYEEQSDAYIDWLEEGHET